MDKQLQTLQHNLEAAAQRADAEGIEFWFARDLQAPPGLCPMGELSNGYSASYGVVRIRWSCGF